MFCRSCTCNPASELLLISHQSKKCWQFADMTSSSICFDVDVFLLSSLVTGPSFISILLLVLIFLDKWLTRNPESEIPPSEFYPISGDWGKLEIPKLEMSLIKCYWILQNSRGRSFTISKLLRENQQGVKLIPPPRLGLRSYIHAAFGCKFI